MNFDEYQKEKEHEKLKEAVNQKIKDTNFCGVLGVLSSGISLGFFILNNIYGWLFVFVACFNTWATWDTFQEIKQARKTLEDFELRVK